MENSDSDISPYTYREQLQHKHGVEYSSLVKQAKYGEAEESDENHAHGPSNGILSPDEAPDGMVAVPANAGELLADIHQQLNAHEAGAEDLAIVPEEHGRWLEKVQQKLKDYDAEPDDLAIVFKDDYNQLQGLQSEYADSAGIPEKEADSLSLGTLRNLAADSGNGSTPDPKSMAPEGTDENESAEISRLKAYREKLEEKDSRLAEQMIDDVDDQIAELQGR